MCLATPLQIKELNGSKATVGDENHTHQVDISLLEDLQVGDWVICHADLALNRIEEKEAREILELSCDYCSIALIQ